VFSDFLNLFLFDSKNELATVIKALQNRGLFQSLAEPNLVAESGKEASFLAGGEFPVPVAQGTGANLAITIEWKEFGIRLSFTPTVNGDRVHLRVRPEVSALDFNNAVVTQGIRVPSLTTRRTETELELDNQQTFAIAGLLNNTMNQSLQRIPGIGDIPILGYLFRSKAAQKNQTELVVMITPEILPAKSPGVTPNLPRLIEPFLPPTPPNRLLDPPPPPFGRSRSGPDPVLAGAPAPVPSAPIPGAPPAEGSIPVIASGGGAPAESGLIESPSPAADSTSEQPAPGPAEAAPADPAPVTRALTPQEQRAAREEQEREEKEARERQKVEARAQAEAARRLAEQGIAEKREAQREAERQEKLAREQARRDTEAAKQAEREAARRAEAERRHQKAIDEAAARLKAAEDAYEAEIGSQAQNNP
jgi:hypothetical protein